MKTLLFVYFALVIIALSSCQKPGGGEAIVAGMNSKCISNPAACNSSAYQQSQGYYPYGYNSSYGRNYNYGQYYSNPFSYSNNTAYLCNCPYGTLPTYNSYAGLGCVNSVGLSNRVYGYFYIGWGQNQWTPRPQLNSYSYNAGSCYSGAVQSCLAGAGQTCPIGYYCSANAGSNIGLCVSSRR